jgi:hypothetical protein
MSGSPARFKCQDCTIILTPKITVSNKGTMDYNIRVPWKTPHPLLFALSRIHGPLHHRRPYSQPSQIKRFCCTKRRVNVKCPPPCLRDSLLGPWWWICTSLMGPHRCLQAQVFQAAYQLPHSQTPPATFPMTTPTFTPLRISPPLPPASISATQTTGSSVIEAGTSSGVTVSHAIWSSTPISCSHGLCKL